MRLLRPPRSASTLASLISGRPHGTLDLQMSIVSASRVLSLLGFVAFAHESPAMAQHETRSWKEMKPCKSEGHVYFAGPIWANNDPNLAFAVNAVGPAIMQGAKQIIEQAGLE